MSILKYHIIPGFIRSKYDGDEHYITADKLMRLYQVEPYECTTNPIEGLGLLRLTPRYHGDYVEWLEHLKLASNKLVLK